MATGPYTTRQQSYQYPANARLSARSQYPSFLSIQDTVLLQLKWAWRGLFDAFRWDAVISVVARYAHGLICVMYVDLNSIHLSYLDIKLHR